MNAGVEAARANQAGQGFAVVASAVQQLAQRSSEAASEIKELIRNSSQQVTNGVSLVGRAGDVITEISSRVGDVTYFISDIATSAADQSEGLDELNAGVTQLDTVTQENVAMIEKTNAAIQSMTSDTAKLSELVAFFCNNTETDKGEIDHTEAA